MSDFEWVDPHAAEITEFAVDPVTGNRENDACGPTASEVCRACIDGRAPTVANMLAIRRHDLAAGLFGIGRGQRVQELVKATPAAYHVTLYPDPVDYVAPNHDALAAQLVTALRDRHSPCVLNVGNASALQGNEHGVQWHFVAAVGIRSVGGAVSILIANGDEIPFLGRPRWVPLAEIGGGDLVAIVEFHRPQGAPVMSTVPAGWHYDGTTLTPTKASDIDHQPHAVAHELNATILNWPGGWDAGNVPQEEVQDDSPGRFHQTFSDMQWRATKDAAGHWSPFPGNIGVDLLLAQAQIAHLTAQVAALTAQLAQHAPTVDPAAATAVAAIQALKAALK